MPVAVGSRLGHYDVTAPLGAGGMGEVYKATDTRLDRTVAIKVLPEHVAADPDLKQRFEREARTVAALNHPHICTLHDIGSQDGIDFLVMEYLDGETLAQRLEKGALPLYDSAPSYAKDRREQLVFYCGRGVGVLRGNRDSYFASIAVRTSRTEAPDRCSCAASCATSMHTVHPIP